MKTETEIRSWLSDVQSKLKQARIEFANNPPEGALTGELKRNPELDTMRRLEGNIGALEWVLRDERCTFLVNGKQCGLSSADLIHHRDELRRRENEKGMPHDISDSCHEYKA